MPRLRLESQRSSEWRRRQSQLDELIALTEVREHEKIKLDNTQLKSKAEIGAFRPTQSTVAVPAVPFPLSQSQPLAALPFRVFSDSASENDEGQDDEQEANNDEYGAGPSTAAPMPLSKDVVDHWPPCQQGESDKSDVSFAWRPRPMC